MNSVSALYAQDFGNSQLILAAVFVLVAIGLSRFLKLDLGKDFFVAALRTTIQLIAVGYILRWVLQIESFGVNLLILLVMTLVAAQAVVSRLKKKSMRVYLAALSALIGSVWPLGFLCLSVFFHEQALKQSAFFVPFMGVLLGNALASISLSFVGLERVRAESTLEIEVFKSLGASSFESCQRIYRDLLRSSLTPILNGMTVVGVVSLPGVMAGQLIGGVDPLTAARFQILVMFVILLTALVGSLLAVVLNHFFFMPRWLTAEEPVWSLPVAPQQKLALSGPSGSGKSRLMKSLVGLDDAEIKHQVKKRSALQFVENEKNPVQYLHQKAQFIPGTVKENLQWPFRFKKHQNEKYDTEIVETLLGRLGLAKEILDKEALTLSGGEGQLIHLIRGLQFKPQILMLDEPSASLDPERTKKLEDFLNEWVKQGSRRLALVTHNQEQIKRFATEVILLKDGELVYG